MEQGNEQPEEPIVTFEDALVRLEAVVANLEQGEMTLAESLEAFREGIKNLGICVGHLDAFESQVEVLLSEYYASAPSWLGGADPGGRPR